MHQRRMDQKNVNFQSSTNKINNSINVEEKANLRPLFTRKNSKAEVGVYKIDTLVKDLKDNGSQNL